MTHNPPKKKVWCKHIVSLESKTLFGTPKGFLFWFIGAPVLKGVDEFLVPRSWIRCPICPAQRPKSKQPKEVK